MIVIMDENFSYSAFQKPGVAPFLHSLAATCGSETFMHAATHPSQPNYMAATSGMATGVGVRTASENVFDQMARNGKSWRTYEESMPVPCSATQYTIAPAYKSGHNPAFWYTDLRTPTDTCKLYDLALSPALDSDITADHLPAFAWVAPNLCHDMAWDTSCGYAQSSKVAVGDTWLSTFIPRLTALPSFRSGRSLVIVTVDEGGGSTATGVDCSAPTYYPTHPDCQIPTIVLSAYVHPGAVDPQDHS
ncbi:MAG: alkaline phosphatase family protein, partial [Actinomycetes bacterium]